MEIYDPSDQTWTPTATTLNAARHEHTANLMLDGRVLVVGGRGDVGILSTTEIYDPDTGVWTVLNSRLAESRVEHTATLLPDGRVVVVNGLNRTWQLKDLYAGTEIFDPRTNGWSSFPGPSGRRGHTATLLLDGGLLVVGGWMQYMGTFDDSLIASTPVYPETRRPRLFSGDVNNATFDPALGVPVCATASSHCDSGALLEGRDAIAGGAEPNAPNTLDGCADETAGSFHVDESIDRIRVYTTDGSPLTEDEQATIEVTLWANNGTSDRLELYHAADAYGALWNHVDTLIPGEGRQTLTASYTLSVGDLQAVRARLHRSGTTDSCGAGSFDDHDDLVFAVGTDATLPIGPFYPGEPASVSGSGLGGDSETSDGTTQSSPVNYPFVSLRAVEGDRVVPLELDPLPNLHDGPTMLTVPEVPGDLAAGQYRIRVTASGVPSVARMVEVGCAVSIVGQPEDATGDIDGVTVFEVGARAARHFQWQRCTTDACDPGDWLPIPGATDAVYTTPPITAADSGTRFRVEVRGSCGLNADACEDLPYSACVVSEEATLTVQDDDAPVVDVVSPDGGEYWLLSDENVDVPANTELVTWSMTDDVRVCSVEVALQHLDTGLGEWVDTVADCGLAGGCSESFGPGGTCVDPGVTADPVLFTIPRSPPSGTPGSLYQIRVTAVDHAGNAATAHSGSPFFIVRPNPEAVKTLILAHPSRMESVMGVGTSALTTKLYELADHPRVQGFVVDLAGVASLGPLYDAWDSSPGNATLANAVVVGIHDYLLDELLGLYSGVEHLVLVGDDRIIPFARMADGAALLPESTYTDPVDGDLTDSSTVGKALDQDLYLSDDPLAVLDPVSVATLPDGLFIPDLGLGRLVEGPDEIITTIATFISQDGFLDLSTLDPDTGHKVLATGYDFLIDAATVIRERWKSALGVSTPANSTAPVDGVLIGSDWGESTVEARRTALADHLSGLGVERYGISSLNGHATHYEEGVPGADPFDIQGLECVDLPPELAGGVVYAVGCHSGLTVPGSSGADADHSLDLAESFLTRGVVAYVANTGYGWGLKHGIGYAERLVEIFSEELTGGGTVAAGDAVRRAKQRYYLESPRFDPYDSKTLMQWQLYGLPMYAIKTGIAAGGAKAVEEEDDDSDGVENLGPVRVATMIPKTVLPSYLTRLDMHFDLTAPGVYTKRGASGEPLPDDEGCPDPEGCYYTLHGLVERGTGSGDLPIQPYLIYESRLAGTSQHGVLWKGGTYDEESGWVPVIAELISNGGDASDHGDLPRLARTRPGGTRVLVGEDPEDCRPSDLELNGLVVTAGEAAKPDATDEVYTIQRVYSGIDLEVLYFNDTSTPTNNCDREGPLLGTGPHGGDYHRVVGETVKWSVPASDGAGVWRVVVVYDDGSTVGGQGSWRPLELAYDPDSGHWQGAIDAAGVNRLTYVVQAVDARGNVTWLEWTAAQLPASGVPHDLPATIDVDLIDIIFQDGFESGNIDQWSGSTG
jgi:hypothetical protein